jgi:hypothetical protein
VSEVDPLVSHARLAGQTRGVIRRLAGFQRGRHRVPEEHDAAAERFLVQAGADTVAERAAEIHAAVRKAFGYTRRKLVLEQIDASASIRAPDFALRLWLEQDPKDPAAWIMPLELGGFASSAVLENPALHQAFNAWCDRIVISLPAGSDVLARVDALEDAGFTTGLDYDPTGAWLELIVPRDDLVLRMTPNELSLRLITGPDLPALITRGRQLVLSLAGDDTGLLG